VLEYAIDGTWYEIYNEKKTYTDSDNETLRVVDGKKISFYLSQDDFFKDAQVMFETLDPSIDVQMRTVYYGREGEIVVGANDIPLVDEFTFTVTGTGVQSACVDKIVTYNDQARDY
jgi:hypothetical protein